MRHESEKPPSHSMGQHGPAWAGGPRTADPASSQAGLENLSTAEPLLLASGSQNNKAKSKGSDFDSPPFPSPGMRFGFSRKKKQGSTDSAESVPEEDSASDPQLLQAILESFKLHHPDGSQNLGAASRFLCRNLSEADPSVAASLRQQRAAHLHTSPDGITFFEHSEDDYPLMLPSFQGHPPEVRQQVLRQLCNDYLQQEAEEAGVINCIPGCTQQFVLNTQGDGNCLFHACSLGIWGVHDRDSQLRGAIRANMTHPVVQLDIKARFELQLRQNGIPQEDWPAEWRRELTAFHNSARMSDRYLSDVHCFTLANVLRRPLVLYGDEHAALAGLTGVYLPLLWAPNECCRDPVSVLFWGSHFSLLCTVEGEGPTQPPLLPLCTRDGPLQVRFLSSAEARQHGGTDGGPPLALLEQYMTCEVLPGGAVWHNQHQAHGGSGSGSSDAQAVGVRLSVSPAPPALLHLLEAAFVSQTAALCGLGGSRRRSTLQGSSRRSSFGRADSRRSSLGGGPAQPQALVA